MLVAVHSSVPELDAVCCLSYEEPSILRYGQREILSSEGVQLGDPLGPLLFSLTLHPLLCSLKSELSFGYLDDVTIGGNEVSVEEDVKWLMKESQSIGLSVNISKCDGLRPQHILQLILCPVQGRETLTALTGFINLLLKGKCHPAVIPINENTKFLIK